MCCCASLAHLAVAAWESAPPVKCSILCILTGSTAEMASCHGAGEQPTTAIIASITPGNPTLVTCVDDERLELEVGVLTLFRLGLLGQELLTVTRRGTWHGLGVVEQAGTTASLL